MQFVGMDAAKSFSQVCVMDEQGSVLLSEKVANTPESMWLDPAFEAALAHLLRRNLILESYVPPQYVRDERQVARLRASFVDIRTQVKNKIHAILRNKGITYEFSDLFGQAGMSFLHTIELPAASRFELDQYLLLLAVLNERIEAVQEQVQAMASNNYGARLLMTIP